MVIGNTSSRSSTVTGPGPRYCSSRSTSCSAKGQAGRPGTDAADALDGVAHDIAGTLRCRELGIRGHVDLRQAVEQIPSVVARLDGRPRLQHGVRVQEGAGYPRRIEGQHDPRIPLDVAQLRDHCI